MKTAVIGAGRGCLDVLQLLEQGQLEFLDLEIGAVVDIDADAPGMVFARQRGWPTWTRLEQALAVPELELIIELTGSNEVLDQIYHNLPPGVRVMDHVTARVFWDLEKVARNLRAELSEKTELQSRVARDRAQLQEILDAIPDLVVVLNEQMRITRINRQFERVTGRYRDRVLGRTPAEAFDGADHASWGSELASLFGEVMISGRPLTVSRIKETRLGREGHFQITASPILDDDLQIVRVIASAREITEQVMLKRETEESARRFQQIIDAVHGIITIKDLQGRYQLVNPRTEQVVGIDRREMIGRSAAELFPKEAAEEIVRHDEETLARGGRHVTEEIYTIGGKERVLVSERFPLTDYKGEVVGICCVARDMTRQRHLQQELVRSERLAAVGKLAAGVAHELNNPLSGILAFAEDLLLEAGSDDPLRQDYEVIVNETLRCRRIVRDVLELARQRTLERHWVQINDVISRMLVMVERQASFHNITFNLGLDPDLPQLFVDPHKIQQALLNLVINARDSMNARGEISIRSHVAEEGRSVGVSVTDKGCGIPQDQMGQIFEPFFSTKGEEGHGLGLAAVVTIVEQHEGRVEVESRVGVGTTFRVILSRDAGTIEENKNGRDFGKEPSGEGPRPAQSHPGH